MKYVRQSQEACLAYALYQLDLIDERALRAYEKRVSGPLSRGEYTDRSPGLLSRYKWWLDAFVPDMAEDIYRELRVVTSGDLPSLKGKGIVMVKLPLGFHAISYEDGLVLDPSGPGRPETLEAYLERANGKFIKIVPAKE